MLEISWSVGKPHNALQGHVLNIAHILILIGLLKQSYQETYSKEIGATAPKKVKSQDKEQKKEEKGKKKYYGGN